MIDNVPIPPFSDLSAQQHDDVASLFSTVASSDDESSWEDVDSWVARLYGLKRRDLDVITDTLRYGLPFSENRRFSQSPPSPEAITEFTNALRHELAPFISRLELSLELEEVSLPTDSPWVLLRLQPSEGDKDASVDDWNEILKVADDVAASEVIHPDEPSRCLWLARLRQARYWTRTQARLVSRRMAWEHAAFFTGLGHK